MDAGVILHLLIQFSSFVLDAFDYFNVQLEKPTSGGLGLSIVGRYVFYLFFQRMKQMNYRLLIAMSF